MVLGQANRFLRQSRHVCLIRREKLLNYLVKVLSLRLMALFRVHLRGLKLILVTRASELDCALDCELHPVTQVYRHRLGKVVRLDKLGE